MRGLLHLLFQVQTMFRFLIFFFDTLPYAWGSVMKLTLISSTLAATNTSEPISLLRSLIIWMSRGLNKWAARCSSSAHSPFLLLWASSAGTQPSGPVPVTITLRAPSSYSLWNENLESWCNNCNAIAKNSSKGLDERLLYCLFYCTEFWKLDEKLSYCCIFIIISRYTTRLMHYA